MTSNPSRRFVRQFALTQGRAHSIGRDLPLDTIVTVTDGGLEAAERLDGEEAVIIDLCRRPLSIAEIAVHTDVHLGIARVLVSDMASNSLVCVSTSDFGAEGPDLTTLERLLDDLQAF